MDLSGISVLCFGDVMLDRFVYGEVERISPEAPVPVLRLSRTQEMLGGAGNVVNNIASLGGRAVLVGLVGRDEAGTRLRALLDGVAAVEARCIDTSDRPTVCKTRFIAGTQQVVRADEESQAALTPGEEGALLDQVRAALPRVRAMVLADYGKGVLNPATVRTAVDAARAAGVPVFVDPKTPDFTAYRGATCITPNLKELAAASGLPVNGLDEVVGAGRRVMAAADAAAILVTRSEKGMTLVEADGSVHSVPARARQVFDVSGAGDTVIAAMALCHAAGRTLPQAMHIANAAASVVVSKLGTATATMAEVTRELDAQDHEWGEGEQHVPEPAGLHTRDEAQALVRRWKEQGLAVGFTNGCFDILHPGHISLLNRARRECDRLVVGLNDDNSVRRLKGAWRPVNTLDARATVLAALRSVDCVVGFGEDTPLELIRVLLPDVLVKGADYAPDQVVGAREVVENGGRLVLAVLVPGQSTTGIIGRMMAPAGA